MDVTWLVDEYLGNGKVRHAAFSSKRREQLGELLAKGDKVVIEGSLRYSQWETKDGERRSNIEIIIEEVEFLRIHAFE